MKTILLSGEGPNELGDGAKDPRLRPQGAKAMPVRGVLEALLRRVREDGWEVQQSIVWKDIRKYRAGDHRDAECRNVLGLVAAASQFGLDAVVFSRDRDGHKNRAREKSIHEGLADAARIFGPRSEVVGGIMVERLESWIAALLGTVRSEELKDDAADQVLRERGQIEPKDTNAMVAAVEQANLAALPEDAASLRAWLEQARRMLLDPE